MQVHGKNALKTGTMLMVGATLLASGLTTQAQAKDRKDRHDDNYKSKNEGKADNLKKGAIALGAIGAVLAAKGKVLPAVIAGAGGYYLYKKGRSEDRNDSRYPNYHPGSKRNQGGRDSRYDDNYPNGDYRNGSYSNGDYQNGGHQNGDDRNRDYRDNDNRDYGYDASYNDRNDRNRDNDRDQNCPPDQQDNNRGHNRDRANRPYAVR